MRASAKECHTNGPLGSGGQLPSAGLIAAGILLSFELFRNWREGVKEPDCEDDFHEKFDWICPLHDPSPGLNICPVARVSHRSTSEVFNTFAGSNDKASPALYSPEVPVASAA
jgi:hypothetical protein